MRPLLAKATLVVVPIAAASGTRLKILQALAAGRAVVSTPAGAQGLPFQSGRELMIAPLADDFAAAVVRLLQDEAERAALIAAGRAAVERFDWDNVLQPLDDVYAELPRDQLGRGG
jgi:glycosyltransferase involved in cell wall biosynthesis